VREELVWDLGWGELGYKIGGADSVGGSLRKTFLENQDLEMVCGGPCNHPNCLVLPFIGRLELIPVAA